MYPLLKTEQVSFQIVSFLSLVGYWCKNAILYFCMFSFGVLPRSIFFCPELFLNQFLLVETLFSLQWCRSFYRLYRFRTLPERSDRFIFFKLTDFFAFSYKWKEKKINFVYSDVTIFWLLNVYFHVDTLVSVFTFNAVSFLKLFFSFRLFIFFSAM